MVKRGNRCAECVLSEPLKDMIGSLKDGERYYFIVAGKQRRCIPLDKSVKKCQRMIFEKSSK